MSVEIVRYEPALLDAVRRFAERTWQRPRTAPFYLWRYTEAPGQRAFLAMRDGECLAMVCALCQPYRVDDEIVDVLGFYDWYALPGLSERGLGTRVMQRLMEEPEPLLQVGGTEHAVRSLGKLGWSRVTSVECRVLRLGTAWIRRGLQHRRLAPAAAARAIAAAARPIARRPHPPAPRGGRVIAVASVGDEIAALYRGPVAYGTLPLWTRERLRWLLAGFPGNGHYVPLYFAGGEALLGWALLRIQGAWNAFGFPSAELVELMNPRADADLYAWMIAEVARIAEGFGAEQLVISTTCEAICDASRRVGCVAGAPVSVHACWPGADAPPAPWLLGANTRDTGFRDYPAEWWDENATLPGSPLPHEPGGDAPERAVRERDS